MSQRTRQWLDSDPYSQMAPRQWRLLSVGGAGKRPKTLSWRACRGPMSFITRRKAESPQPLSVVMSIPFDRPFSGADRPRRGFSDFRKAMGGTNDGHRGRKGKSRRPSRRAEKLPSRQRRNPFPEAGSGTPAARSERDRNIRAGPPGSESGRQRKGKCRGTGIPPAAGAPREAWKAASASQRQETPRAPHAPRTRAPRSAWSSRPATVRRHSHARWSG